MEHCKNYIDSYIAPNWDYFLIPKHELPKASCAIQSAFPLETGNINDLAISNNNDSEKVLATVVSTLYAFTDKHPDGFVYATGSTKARTRLYRMGIAKYLVEITEDYYIYGLRNNEWENFEKEIEYDAFLAKRKK